MSGLTCRKGGALLAARRAGLIASDRLRLEAHLAACARCRGDADQLDRVVSLMDRLPARVSSPASRAAALQVALEAATQTRHRQSRVGLPAGRTWLVVAAAAALVFVGQRLFFSDPAGPDAQVLAGVVHAEGETHRVGDRVPDGVALSAAPGAALRLGRAEVTTGAPTRVRWSPTDNTVKLLAGQVTAEVEHDAGRPFRVATERFTVEVTGTRFTVTDHGVSVSRGSVRVLDPRGQVLVAAVGAGEAFELRASETLAGAPTGTRTEPVSEPRTPPAATVGPSPSRGETPPARRRHRARKHRRTASTPAAPRATEATNPPGAVQPRETSQPAPTGAALLQQARRRLASRDADGSRALVRQAMGGPLTRAERAEAETLLAEGARASGDTRLSARRYAAIADRYRDLAAGQNALFAAARAELQLGRRDTARKLLLRYKARYPSGQLAREVDRQLAALEAGPEAGLEAGRQAGTEH